jgi:outer membrane receptor protein involved in Fe transport
MIDPYGLAISMWLNAHLAPLETTTYVFHFARGLQEPPVKDVFVTVQVPRSRKPASDTAAGTKRTNEDMKKFGGVTGDVKNVTKTTAGVSQDSAGQQHVRGEHAEITYVIDGVPLPDTLSGRQGSVVVPATIQSVDVLVGGFAPEYGIQTAAILDISTLPRATKNAGELELEAGDFGVRNGRLTAVGPLGERLSYVLNLSSNRTERYEEPQQPDNQTAHNRGSDQGFYTKLGYLASSRDRLSFTLSLNPSQHQVNNRAGLPDSFAAAGQGFGFQGLRNRDGAVPGGDPTALGGTTMPLLSQEDAGMDIDSHERNNFGLLTWRHQFSDRTVGNLGFVLLHTGQDVTNGNPAVDLLNLPVDNSIEFNPTASRNVHHVQVSGSLADKQGPHALKAGFVYDKQTGSESYQLVPASQLALNGLYALAPNLAPAGHLTGATDVYGNPVYVADSNVSSTLKVDRDAHYLGVYLQDTWNVSPRLTANYGLRFDDFASSQSLAQDPVSLTLVSPRLNLSYRLDDRTTFAGSYNKLFNTPPLAQGALVGQAIKPPVVDQYDLSVEHRISANQTVKLSYYAKQIQNQVDTGLLIPGSEIGLYSAVNLGRGGVHGVEFAYELSATGGVGWDGYVNYSYSAAKPNGQDSTGADVGEFNDHDQRQTLGVGASYTFRSGASAALTLDHGSGLASSIVPPSTERTPRTTVNLHLATGDRLFQGRGGVSLDVTNLFDRRDVINFQSAFSGTRFQLGRAISLTANYKF